MDGGNLFRVRTDARTRVRAEMAELLLHKNEVGGYAYNDAKTLAIQIERVLERQLFEDSSDGMKGLASSTPNTLTKYRANINIKKKDVIAQSAAAAADASTSTNTVAPEITADNAQEEADRQNVFRLAAIGVKEAIAAGITAIVGESITNPILRTPDGTDFKTVDDYDLADLLQAVAAGAERPEATTIRRQFVGIAGTVFDFRETVATNVERFAATAAKAQGFGIKVHDDLKAIVVLANVEWAAQQTWGAEISVAHQKIKEKYLYNHAHDAASIKAISKILAAADESRDRRKAKAPEELADMVSQGMTRLQQLVLQAPPATDYSDTSDESANAATTSDSEGTAARRGRRKKRENSRSRRRPSPSPSTSRSPSPPPRRRRSKRATSKKRDDSREKNPTGCKYCKKFGGNGYAHGPPKNIPHSKCNYNKKWKGWRPEWVCKKIGVDFKEYDECSE